MPADTDELAALRADVQALKQAALSPSSRISLSVAEFYKMTAAVVVAVAIAMIWFETSINSLKTDLKTEINVRLDRTDARIDKIDTRLDRTDARFDKLDTRIDALSARIDGRLDTLNTRLDRIETEVKRR